MTMGIRAVAMTHPGQIKTVNQDAVYAKYWVCDGCEIGVIAVADGMGGHARGDDASKIAIDQLEVWCSSIFNGNRQNFSLATVSASLDGVFQKIHSLISDQNRLQGDTSGTTFTVCVCIGNEYLVKNIGDTRCYIVSIDNARQISIDDSWLAEQIREGKLTETDAHNHPKQNLLTRCVGLGEFSAPNFTEGVFENGQVVCVCSDGFYKRLDEQEIVKAAVGWKNENVNPLKTMLPVLFERGEMDNLSLALISM